MSNYMQKRIDAGEVVGGGFFVFRRGKTQNRVRFKFKDTAKTGAHIIPFEHGDLDSALREAARLAHKNPGESYCVFQQVFGPVRVEPKAASLPVDAAA